MAYNLLNGFGEQKQNWEDNTDFYDAARYFCSELTEPIKGKDMANMVWDVKRYQKLLGDPLRIENDGNEQDFDSIEKFNQEIKERLDSVKESVNPSLWRQALLNNMHGLYKVCDGIYQVRGYDLANMTIVETDQGIVVIDCTTVEETAAAALKMYREFSNNDKPVQAVILTHTHVDHYGGIHGVLNEKLYEEGQNPVEEKQKPIIIAPEHFLEEAALENALVGDAMSRRSTYQYGTFLNVLDEGEGKVDAGLGKDIQKALENEFHITRTDFANLILGLKSFDELKKNMIIKCKESLVEDFFALFEKIDINFNIVTPKKSAK